jgi:hypothetical protein
MSSRSSRLWLAFCIAAVATAIGVAWWHSHKQNEGDSPPLVSFDASSDQLQQTVIVPTLDSPIPEGKSAIWCASFQLAWNRLKDDVTKGPVQITNAQPIADRLNRADQSEDDLDDGTVYAAAGLAKDGIVEHIQTEMARKFPNVPRPELDVPPTAAVAYAYLAASATYDYPFFENDEPFTFRDSAGKQTAVGSFGVRKKDDYAYHRLRRQVQVLYCPRTEIMAEQEVSEFIIDPCKTSQPNQIVFARVDRKPTLAETLAYVQEKVAAQVAAQSYMSQLNPRDTLIVPNMAWKITHRFKELEGKDKEFLNPALRGLYLDAAIQTIQVRLDRNGAELASEAKVFVKPGASYFHVNRPFLVYVKKRAGKHPFFVAWVENAELLERK